MDDSRRALQMLAHHLEVSVREVPYQHRVRRRGAGRLADGRRILWKFHGIGVFLRLSGQRPVDFDFHDVGERFRLESDLWKLSTTRGMPEPTSEQRAPLAAAGLLSSSGKFAFDAQESGPGSA